MFCIHHIYTCGRFGNGGVVSQYEAIEVRVVEFQVERVFLEVSEVGGNVVREAQSDAKYSVAHAASST